MPTPLADTFSSAREAPLGEPIVTDVMRRHHSNLPTIRNDLLDHPLYTQVNTIDKLRLLHNAHVINIKGRSYRLRDLDHALGGTDNKD